MAEINKSELIECSLELIESHFELLDDNVERSQHSLVSGKIHLRGTYNACNELILTCIALKELLSK